MALRRLSLSVVVIGLNEAENLERCFTSVQRAVQQAYHLVSEWSLIYVDSGSTDQSLQIAKRFTENIFVLTADPSAAAARTVGLCEANGEVVLFLDGDMELHSEWLKEALPYFQSDSGNEGYVGVIGVRTDIYVDPVSKNVVGHRENVYGVKDSRRAPHFGGALLALRQKIQEVGGYRPDLKTREESDLYARMVSRGMSVLEIPVPFVNHYTEPRLSALRWFVRRSHISRHRPFVQTFLYAIKEGYMPGFIKIYRHTILVWLTDLVSLAGVLAKGMYILLAAQLLLVLGFIVVGKKSELVQARVRLIALCVQIPKLLLGTSPTPVEERVRYIRWTDPSTG